MRPRSRHRQRRPAQASHRSPSPDSLCTWGPRRALRPSLAQRATDRHSSDFSRRAPSAFRSRWRKGTTRRLSGFVCAGGLVGADASPVRARDKTWRSSEGYGRFWSTGAWPPSPRRAGRGPKERTLSKSERVRTLYERVRTPYRTPYPPADEQAPAKLSRCPLPSATPVDPDKRPKEQVENDQPISAQVRRAKERGRGRRATSPWQIPWAGWKDILWRVYASINDNRLLAVAGGVVFYSLLAIFPAIAAFVSLYGLIADASTIDSHLSMAAGVLPAGAVDILHEQIVRTDSEDRRQARTWLHYGTSRRAVERQRGNEGNHRRAQCRL